jgi:hypothetical protein
MRLHPPQRRRAATACPPGPHCRGIAKLTGATSTFARPSHATRSASSGPAALWGIDSFDQWGVELGKSLAQRLVPRFASGDVTGLDPSTAALLRRVREPG